MPLKACGLVTICYLENPLMKGIVKPLLLASSFAFTFKTLELVDLEVQYLFLIGLGLGAITLGLDYTKKFDNGLAIFYEIISVFAAIGYISILSGLIIDFITFLAYYFSIDEVILNSILLSAGNTIGDFFGNASLAKAGEAVMGGFATYSGQIFNTYIGFSMSILSATKIDATDFDIFGIYKDGSKPLPAKHYFLICEFITVFALIIFSVVYLYLNKYQLSKKFSYILCCIYLTFFAFSMAFGFLSMA